MGNDLEMEEQLDWLDAKLRDEMPYIDDAGFTASVVQKLPVQRKRATHAMRAAILLAAAFLASAVAFILAGPTLAASAAYLFALPTVTVVCLAATVVLAVMLTAGSVVLSRTRDLTR